MIALKPRLKFKETGIDTNEKDRERKLEDQETLEKYFHEIVGDYFNNRSFQCFRKEFDPKKHRLDVFVPTYGSFTCGQRSVGKRKGKNKIEVANSNKQSGCGRTWNSYLTMTKFVCFANENDLVVEMRQFGQRCERCSKERSPYENPSFKKDSVYEMMKFILVALLDEMFNHIETHLDVDFNILGGPPPRRSRRFGRKQIVDDNGEISARYHDGINCEACELCKGCGKRKKQKRRRKKAKETLAK